MMDDANELHISVERRDARGTLLDCGINTRGGLEAGRRLAEVCLAGHAEVSISPGVWGAYSGPAVSVRTDAPVAACLASQYAGWKVATDEFFAMASGPMRAAIGKEPLFEKINHCESVSSAVGVLETRQVPPDDVFAKLADECGIDPGDLTLLVAPTASVAASVQITARSIETALHKMLELGFDIETVESGFGSAPIAPVAGSDLAAIGRTNDAILYGADVSIYIRADDAEIAELGPQIPSTASSDYGQPFVEVFERYDHDFYKIDPHLFSPARITLVNLASGSVNTFGQLATDVLERSFQAP